MFRSQPSVIFSMSVLKMRLTLFLSTKKIKIQRFKSHQDLVESDVVEAVIIATPDHWHAPIAITAVQAGKHLYVEIQ